MNLLILFIVGLINNCRTFYKFFISHEYYMNNPHLSMADDKDLAVDQLPAGHTPVWIELPNDVTQVEMLERVESSPTCPLPG